MQDAPGRRSPLHRWGLPLGLFLIAVGLAGWYVWNRGHTMASHAVLSTGLVCKIQLPAQPRAGKKSSQMPPPAAMEITGARLQLSGASQASTDETVVVSLCVAPVPELPPQRRQALKDHLLVQLSAVGLQIEPHEKIPAAISTPQCLGAAEWTVRANTPGRYTAVLVPESTDQQAKATVALTKPRWDFDLQMPARFDIQFHSAWSDLAEKIWGPVSAALGLVLVVTQILLNLQQRKKARSA